MCDTPTISNQENAIIAANNLAKALSKPDVQQDIDLETMGAIEKLAAIFKHKVAKMQATTQEATIPPTPKRIEQCTQPPRVPVTKLPAATPPRVPIVMNPIGPTVIDAFPQFEETPTADEDCLLRHRYPTRFSLSQHANAIISDTGQALEYRDLIQDPNTRERWANSMCNEIGRLAQGRKSTGLKGTNTLKFIPFQEIPQNRRKDITYARIVVDYRPQKAEPHRTRITVGGDRINYPYKVTTETAEITTHKLLLNSVVSTPNARYMTADIGNFYLGTPMERPEYMFLPLSYIPDEIIDEYDLHKIAKNEKVYTEVRKGMYGLPQAGILANHKLKRDLLPFGYYPCRHTPG